MVSLEQVGYFVTVSSVAVAVLKWEAIRIRKIIDRIPNEEWFEKVGKVLDGWNVTQEKITVHERRIETVEKEREKDHERLSNLLTEHSIMAPHHRVSN